MHQSDLKLVPARNGVFVWLNQQNIEESMSFVAQSPGERILFVPEEVPADVMLKEVARSSYAKTVERFCLMGRADQLSPIESLEGLKGLNFGFPVKAFNVGCLPMLKTLGGVWSKGLIGIADHGAIESICLSDVSAPLQEISPPKLNSLELMFPKMSSLEGIESMKSLKWLRLSRASKLTDINAIASLAGTLKSLTFDTCRKISDYEVLGKLVQLHVLNILTSASIESLDFVRGLRQLETLSIFESKLLNNDLSPCLDLPILKSFNASATRNLKPSVNEVRARIAARNN